MTIREDSWARARVYRKVGKPVSEGGTQLDKQGSWKMSTARAWCPPNMPSSSHDITPDYCLLGVSSLA